MADSVSSSSTAASGSSESQDTAPSGGADTRSPSDLRQEGSLFRSLMLGTWSARQLADRADRGDSFEMGATAGGPGLDSLRRLLDRSHGQDADVASMVTMQHTIQQGPAAQTVAAAAAPEMTFAELVEKHLRRVLASQPASGSSGGELRIELSDAVLPETALSLRRTADGWQLVASSQNRQSREALSRFAPALVARFAQSSLGTLHVLVEPTSPLHLSEQM